MVKRVLVLAIVAGAMVLVGCGEKSGGDSSGRVAVVDLLKIIGDIGQRSKMEDASKVLEQNLQNSARGLAQNIQVKLAEELEKIGKRPEAKVASAPTDEEKKLITEWVGKMRGLERARLEASRKINQAVYQQRQTNQRAINVEATKMRDRIKPLAQSIAKEKGLDIVVLASSVLSHDMAIDITPEVFKKVNELVAAGSFPTVTVPKPTAAPAPLPQPTTVPAPKTGGTTTP